MQLSTGNFLWSLHAMSRLQRIPYAADLVLQQFPPPHTLALLQHAALALGLKTRVKKLPVTGLPLGPLPHLVVLENVGTIEPSGADSGSDDAPPVRSIALLLGCNDGGVQIMQENQTAPEKLDWNVFEARYSGVAILFSAAGSGGMAEDGTAMTVQPFGFKWFVPELLKHKAVWRDVLLASLAIQLLALAVPLLTQVVIDKVIAHHALNTLLVVASALLAILLFNSTMTWVRQYLVLHTGNRVDAVLGTAVFDRIVKLPLRYHEDRPTGVTIARIQGVETIREFVSSAAVTLILDLPFLCIFLAIMFYYSGLLTLIALAVLGFIVILSVAVTPVLRTRINDQFLKGARNQAFLTEYIAGIETVKSLQMEPRVKSRFGDYLASHLQAGFSARQLGNTYNVAANALEQLLTLLVLCVGASLVMDRGGFTVGMLVAFQMFAGRLSQPMLRLVGLWQEFQRAAIAVRRLGDIMNVPEEPYAAVPTREGARQGDIQIDDLSFRYAQNRQHVCRHLTLHIRSGACVAIVGASGSGKSTLAKLLQGFYQPTGGWIRVDGRDIRHLSANELRLFFGVVPQETTLFFGTLYDNLVLANPYASFDQMIAACKMAGIHETIELLPNGYQSEIGEHGTGLSGGQKQRLAIARALLKRPKILIFDEATSNLDRDTAEQFARTINQLKGRATILFITHHIPRNLAVDEVISLAAASKQTADKDASERAGAGER